MKNYLLAGVVLLLAILLVLAIAAGGLNAGFLARLLFFGRILFLVLWEVTLVLGAAMLWHEGRRVEACFAVVLAVISGIVCFL